MKPHLAYANFARFEPHLKAFIDQYPNPYVVDHNLYGMTTSTCSARLRDAKASLKANSWNTMVNTKVFIANYNDIKVVVYDNKVYLTGATAWEEFLAGQSDGAHVKAHSLDVNLSLIEHGDVWPTMQMFAKLRERGAFDMLVRFVEVPQFVFSSEWGERLLKTHDIGLTINPETKTMILV